ncbi:MAG: hypothetical protein [Cressdnaviricota sp.]|nr:MAG: hypothetical protein [Cressdnaviricota sp.]
MFCNFQPFLNFMRPFACSLSFATWASKPTGALVFPGLVRSSEPGSFANRQSNFVVVPVNTARTKYHIFVTAMGCPAKNNI